MFGTKYEDFDIKLTVLSAIRWTDLPTGMMSKGEYFRLSVGGDNRNGNVQQFRHGRQVPKERLFPERHDKQYVASRRLNVKNTPKPPPTQTVKKQVGTRLFF